MDEWRPAANEIDRIFHSHLFSHESQVATALTEYALIVLQLASAASSTNQHEINPVKSCLDICKALACILI